MTASWIRAPVVKSMNLNTISVHGLIALLPAEPVLVVRGPPVRGVPRLRSTSSWRTSGARASPALARSHPLVQNVRFPRQVVNLSQRAACGNKYAVACLCISGSP